MSSYADLSLWHATAGDPWTPRPPLAGDLAVDVAVVGAGFTGLWTAYYLAEARPDLRIAVVEKEVAGFGASGRNGGWASALFPASLGALAALGSREGALAQHRAMRESVDEVIRAASAEGIDADIAKGGTVVLARSSPQLARARAEVDDARSWGRGEDDVRLLDEAEARAVLNATGTLGATYTPDCAAIHPAKLVRGLARAVEGRGVTIHEQTPVTAIEPHRVLTPRGTVSADVVVRATEGYTPGLRGLERAVVPVYSLIIATAPLPESVWSEIGLARRETFSDHRNLIVYGQRTADDRLVFGGRGAPYHFGSRIDPANDRDDHVFASLWSALLEMFPVLARTKVTHSWGGALGIPRDWCASVGLDAATGLGWAGGYVGDGVTTTNLAGRTLRDLVLGHSSDLTALPWVGHRSPAWEPEPLRWLGINAGLRAMTVADAEERVTGRPSLAARAMAPLLGGH
ncbi:Glycine/D-amino acid oxidase [Nocardioides terrae]|uniref:Glycine/D-amino acid oxidase n=1 Tax=Nocardioides terrae TaxID=574651 RepID=A0A1I1GBW2_9ACTN|nr:FAD-dependent oxidoreductase [Nocardioides terrae]SFC09014.1 Glycine/D-amino acid oxidase [Nocardioides terrae]